jgi:hypothetical protein
MSATRSIGALTGEWPLPDAAAIHDAAPERVLDEEPVGASSDGEIESWRDELTGRAREYARAARAESTWAAYDGKWARFNRWCAEHDETSLPADPLTVARFLTDLAPHWRPATPDDPPSDIVAGHVQVRPGLRPSSIAGYLAAISVRWPTKQRPSPTPRPQPTRPPAGWPTRLSTTRSCGC